MSKKVVFVILWLTLSFSLFALEPSSVPCWEETYPKDIVGCLAELEITINTVNQVIGTETPQQKSNRKLTVKNLEVHKKKLEKIQKKSEKNDDVPRVWARSRAIATVGEGCPQMWVHESYAGRGWSFGLGRMVVRIVNNTGVMIDKVLLSNGEIVQKMCPGAAVTLHLTTNGSQYANFFLSAETAAYEGGVRKVIVWNRDYGLSAYSYSREERWELIIPTRQHTYY